MNVVRGRSLAIAGALIVVAVIGASLLWRPGAPSERAAAPPPAAPPAVETPASAEPGAPSRPADASLEVEGSTLTGQDLKGKRLWEMTATGMTVDRESGVVTAEHVAGRIFRGDNETVRFAAPVASYDPKRRVIVLPRGGSGTTSDGRQFSGGRVEIRLREDRLLVDGGVRLVQGDMIVSADSMTSDLHLKKTRLSGRIRVTGVGK